MRRSQRHFVSGLLFAVALLVAQTPASAGELGQRGYIRSAGTFFERVAERVAGLGDRLAAFFGADGATIENDP